MSRPSLRILAVVLLLLAGAIALVLVYRVPLAQHLAERVMAEAGLPAPRLRIKTLDWHGAWLVDLGAGDDQELAIERVQIAYEPLSLLRGEVYRVIIGGLRLRLDATGERPLLGSLTPFFESLGGAPEADDAPLQFPEILLEDAQVQVLTPADPVTLALDGKIGPAFEGKFASDLTLELSGLGATVAGRLTAEASDDGAAKGHLTLAQGQVADPASGLAAEGLAGEIQFHWQDDSLRQLDGRLGLTRLALGDITAGRSELVFDLAPPAPRLDLVAALSDGRLALTLAGELAEDLSLPALQADLSLNIGAQSTLWRLTPLEPAPKGQIDLQVELETSLPPITNITEYPKHLLAILGEQGTQAAISLNAQDLTLADWIQGGAGTLVADLALAGQSGAVSLTEPAQLSVATLAPARVEALGLRPDWIGPSLALSLERGIRLDFQLEGSGPVSADLAGALVLAAGRRLGFDGQVIVDPGGGPVELKELRLQGASGALAGTPLDRLDFAATLAGSLEPAGDGGLPAHDLALGFERLEAQLAARAGLPEPLALSLPGLALTSQAAAGAAPQVAVTLAGGTLDIPAPNLRVGDLALTTTLGPKGLSAPLDLAAELRDVAAEPRFEPLGLSGQLRQAQGRYDGDGQVFLPLGAGTIALTGAYDPERRQGRATFDLPALTFIKGLVQPVNLSPRLAPLKDVTGTLSLKGQMTLDGDRRQGTAELALDGMGFKLNEIPVEDLNLSLQLDQLEPLHSPEGQPLTVARIDPGVPLSNLQARLQVLPGAPATLKIAEATFSAAGGRYRLGETLIDPSAEITEATLEVIGLDLASLLQDYPVEGLTVTGILSGSVPFRLEAGQVALGEARLEADGPGLLQFRSDYADQALLSGGESVELMLQALQDFQYETLLVTANKDFEHNTDIRLEILGNNPNVLDGYPFKFNINLSGNMGSILRAVNQGLELSDDLMRRSWKLSP